jgi:acyl carrier protein
MHVGADGRIDRKAISSGSDEAEAQSDEVGAPRTPTERRIAAIWREVLGVDAVQIHDNFFDIGGHSLLSVRVIAKIESALGCRLDYRVMFLENLEQIAARCDRQSAGEPEATVDEAGTGVVHQ